MRQLIKAAYWRMNYKKMRFSKNHLKTEKAREEMGLREPAKDELPDFASIDRRSRTKALRLKRIFYIQVNVFLK